MMCVHVIDGIHIILDILQFENNELTNCWENHNCIHVWGCNKAITCCSNYQCCLLKETVKSRT
jgi:hypothetical protein